MTMNNTSCASEPVLQHTVARAVVWDGAVHGDQAHMLLVCHPAEAGSGIRFLRRDVTPVRGLIAAHWASVVEARPTVTLANRHGVGLHGATVLLAALRARGIDNALIEVNGPQLPARLSDYPRYLEMLRSAGVQAQGEPRALLHVRQAVEVRDRQGFASLTPAPDFHAKLSVEGMDTDTPAIFVSGTVSSDLREPDTAPASRQAVPVAGAWRALHLAEAAALPLALRGRMIDAFGHLTLAGAPLVGHFHGHRSGPDLHQALLRALLSRRGAAHLNTAACGDDPPGRAG